MSDREVTLRRLIREAALTAYEQAHQHDIDYQTKKPEFLKHLDAQLDARMGQMFR